MHYNLAKLCAKSKCGTVQTNVRVTMGCMLCQCFHISHVSVKFLDAAVCKLHIFTSYDSQPEHFKSLGSSK